jgi:hypothetical protein
MDRGRRSLEHHVGVAIVDLKQVLIPPLGPQSHPSDIPLLHLLGHHLRTEYLKEFLLEALSGQITELIDTFLKPSGFSQASGPFDFFRQSL